MLLANERAAMDGGINIPGKNMKKVCQQ